MRIEDQAILSTWLYYLRSLKLDHNLILEKLTHDNESYAIITNIKENLYNSIFLKNPAQSILLCKELQIAQQKLNIPLTAWVTAETHAPELNFLKNCFYTPGNFYGMLLDLDNAQTIACPSYITIDTVKSPQDVKIYAELYCKILNFPNMLQATELWLKKECAKENPAVLNYIAKVDGKIAGVSSLIINDQFKPFKTGGLYNAGVLPEFRNLGVGTAMACHRVTVAKQLHLKNLSILLMSDAMARGYCNRLGFINHAPLTPFYIE